MTFSFSRRRFSLALAFAALLLPGSMARAQTMSTLPDIAARPSVVIPKTAAVPSLNGDPSGGAWESAAWIGNPIFINDRYMSGKIDLKIGLLWSDEALFVGFKVFGFRKPLAVTTTQGDDGLERDDAVEITLKIPGFAQAQGKPVQFKLNCNGLRDDAIGFDFKWNARWRGAVAQQGNNWSATFEIPFANFGVAPQVGDRWPANFGAFLVGYRYRAFLWSPVSKAHHHDGDFGTLIFGGIGVPSSSIALSSRRGTVTARGTLAAPGQVRVALVPLPSDTDGKPVSAYTAPALADSTATAPAIPTQRREIAVARAGEWETTFNDLPVGRYAAVVEVADTAGRVLNSDNKPLLVAPALDARLLLYPVMGSGAAMIKIFDPGLAPAAATTLRTTLCDARGIVVRRSEQPLRFSDASGQAKALPLERLIELGALKNGARYAAQFETVAADGKVLFSHRVDFQLPPRPSWADTQAGELNGKVLRPWTPVEVKGRALSVWGRRYDWKDGVLPSVLTSQGRPVLSAPMQIVVGHKGAHTRLQRGQAPVRFVASKTGDRADFTAVATASSGRLATGGALEFDGFLTFDLDFTPATAIDSFALEIPLTNELARYVQPLPGAANRDGAGTIPEGGVVFDQIKSFYTNNSLWICNEKIGLFLAWDSTEGWKPPAGRTAEIVRRGPDTLLRLNLFEDARGSSARRHYRFRLQATPIRPFNADWMESGVRVSNGLTWGQNVTALENDVVRSLPAAEAFRSPAGVVEMTLQNRTDLRAVTDMAFEHWGANEKILDIGAAQGAKVTLSFLKERNALTLATPWGALGKSGNARWEPGGTHRVAWAWGDTLRFWVDGAWQGELPVRGWPLQEPNLRLDLGSVSARYTLRGLRVRTSQSTPVAASAALIKTADSAIFLDRPLDLHSRARTMLSDFKARGGRTLIFFEHWNSVQNGGRSKYEPLLKTIVSDAHRLGLKVIFYFGFEVADVPENRDLLDEAKAMVDARPNFYAPQQQSTVPVSYGGAYQEYLLYHMARLKREVGIDGVYLDGTLGFVLSDNPGARSGTTDENGERIGTVPIDRLRAFAKRMNNLFVQDGGIVFAHLNVIPPTMGFASNIYIGEHVGFINTQWTSVHDRIPPDVSRALYNSVNTGVPVVLCLQNMWPHLRGNVPNWFGAAEAWGDLYNVSLNTLLENPMAPEGTQVMLRNRRLADFGADKAQWIPYWEVSGQKLAKLSPNGLLMSVWRRADGAMVCAIANDSTQPVEATVDFGESTRLAPVAGAKASELITGRPLPFEDGRLSVSLPADHSILVRLQ
jgi:hypothetical protein